MLDYLAWSVWAEEWQKSCCIKWNRDHLP